MSIFHICKDAIVKDRLLPCGSVLSSMYRVLVYQIVGGEMFAIYLRLVNMYTYTYTCICVCTSINEFKCQQKNLCNISPMLSDVRCDTHA